MNELDLKNSTIHVGLFQTKFSGPPSRKLGIETSKLFGMGKIQFDLRIFFNWVAQPPTRNSSEGEIDGWMRPPWCDFLVQTCHEAMWCTGMSCWYSMVLSKWIISPLYTQVGNIL